MCVKPPSIYWVRLVSSPMGTDDITKSEPVYWVRSGYRREGR